MKRLALLLALLSAGFIATSAMAASPPKETFAQNYWYEPAPYPEPSMRCRIEFKSKNPDKLLDRISAILAKKDAKVGPRGTISKTDAVLGSVRGPVQTFDVSPAGVESTAKSLTTLDALGGYACSPGSGVSTKRLPAIEEKIGIIEKELKVNSKSLARMPVTRSLLRLNLDYLSSLRDQITSAWAHATIEVTALDVH